MHRLLLPLLFGILLSACQTKEVYELPTSDQDFIELDIDDRKLLMDARPTIGTGYYYRSEESTSMRIEHSTSDHLHALTLDLSGCAFGPEDAPMALGTKAAPGQTPCSTKLPDVTIAYTTFETAGSYGCPHLVGEPTELTGTINIASWTADGRVTGTFETDRDAEHDYVLSGRFETTLE